MYPLRRARYYTDMSNNDKRPAYRVYVDGYDMGTVHGTKNFREFCARQEAKGRTVSYGRA